MYNRIIGKKGLTITVSGPEGGAAQFFFYEQIREIRLDIKELEVRVLLSSDDSYHRVFKIDIQKVDLSEEEAKKIVTDFYNNLVNSTMRLTPEEIENIKKQREQSKVVAPTKPATSTPKASTAKKPAAKKAKK